ncbi:hypothetical protein LPJ53_000635 [Coemansia erecta]|uniref:Zinc metalloprotease n=1 Tax=Coemansia erecta TaxID=147472 RepID=A0A9W7Y620_9FUNG|nr:hypothetical protein LPJ53_000635 [Coemansia erecta]
MASGNSGNEALFVKEGDDFYFEKGTADGSGYRTSVYRHRESQMRVVVSRVPRPLCTLHIYVPTVTDNDKGLPHTLEHLVFCGSQRYPHRGYLDALANCNFSQGTNAWTSGDHTCYTLEASSEQAVANVLPVYLDHVLHPVLRPDQFVTEVYHFDSAGREKGVVFSEMVARESGEYDQAMRALYGQAFGPRSAYRFETGGLTKDIARLTNEEIVAYHAEYYDANNITVVLTGSFSDDFEERVLQTLPAEIVASSGRSSRTPVDCQGPPEGAPVGRTVEYPSADVESGSVWFCWRGPMPEDVETVVALEVLLEYLAENSSSPLMQRFVERRRPLASAVAYGVEKVIPCTIEVQFSGVPYAAGRRGAGGDEAEGSGDEDGEDDEGGDESGDEGGDESEDEDEDVPRLFDERYFERLVVSELQRVHDSGFDGDPEALRKAALRVRQKRAEKMENAPEDAIQLSLCADIVASHFSPGHLGAFTIGSRAQQFTLLDRLAAQPLEYWLGILRTWLVDAPAYHVVMVPDSQLGGRLEEARRAVEQGNAAGVGDAAAHDAWVARAIEANRVDLPEDVKRRAPGADARLIAGLAHEHTVRRLASGARGLSVGVAQVVQVDTGFPSLRLHLPLDALDDRQRAHLVVFQELLLASDLRLPAGLVYDMDEGPLEHARLVDYVTVDRRLADLATAREAAVGYRNARFACGWMDGVFNVRVRATRGRFALAVRWALQAVVFAEFSAERIAAVAQNLLAEVSESHRDGHDMAAAVALHYTTRPAQPPLEKLPVEKPDLVEHHISVLEQAAVLRRVAERARAGDVAEIVQVLDGIRDRLLGAQAQGFVTLGVPAGEDPQGYVDVYVRESSACCAKYRDGSLLAAAGRKDGEQLLADIFPLARALRFPTDLAAPLRVQLALASEQASYAHVYVHSDLFRAPTPSSTESFEQQLAHYPALDYYALRLLCALLDRVDGPLYNAVRGRGYAYGAYFSQALWQDHLSFVCYRASDVLRAISEMRSLVGRLRDHWDEYVGEFEVRMTRSSLVYMNTVATPAALVDCCARANIYGFENARMMERWRNEHLEHVTMEDLRRVYDVHLSKLADPGHPSITVVTTPPDTKLPADAIGAFEQLTLEQLSASYYRPL